MSENPFKIIEPREQVPTTMKKEVMGSVKTVVLLLRFVQLFVGDYTASFIDLFKTDNTSHKNSLNKNDIDEHI